MNDDALQNRTIDIIEPLVPPDAEERVKSSLKQWNQTVRDHIRAETGLKLSEGDKRCAIPVRVVIGFPEVLARLIDDYNDPVMWRLIIGQPKLGGLIQGLEFLLNGWNQFEQWRSLPEPAKSGQPILEQSLAIATSLQLAGLAKEVIEQIKDIHEDILGVYRCAMGQGPTVELYWLPIAMVAAMIDVSIEDLTVVVLIHELAHGYTHLGRDIDGASWADRDFRDSALEVKEGLAQFYTDVITKRLEPRTPTLVEAYESLLTLQAGPYLVHREWIQRDKRQIGEVIRFALIAARTQGSVRYSYWNELMASARSTLAQDDFL